MTETVLRIAHLSINNADGIPCGPYFAHHAEMDHTCEDGWDWMDKDECDMECFKCRLYFVSETLENKGFDVAPVPSMDGLEFVSGVHHSGFDSQEALMLWMGDVLGLLHDNGFALFVYKTDTVRHGGHQVAFEGKSAVLCDILPLISE